jgi:hypothetical protein
VFAVIVLVLLIREWRRKPIPAPENGQLMGHLYTNSTFGFNLTLPTNWPVFHQAELEQGIHKNLPKPKRMSNPYSGGSFAMPDVEVHNLLTASVDANCLTDGTMAPTNTTFTILAQNVSFLPDVNSGKNVLGMWLNISEIAGPSHGDQIYPQGPKEVSVGGRSFYCDTFKVNHGDVSMQRRFYARVEHGEALVFVLLAPTDGEMSRLEQILATTHFN